MKQESETAQEPMRSRASADISPPMLINEISHLFFDRMRATDPPESTLTAQGCRLLLRALIEQGEVTQGTLATLTHLKPPTVSAALREMEREGLVCRTQDKQDKRATRVCVTEKGRTAHEEIRTRLRAMDGILMQGISEEERDQLLMLLTRMRDNVLRDLRDVKGEPHT